MGMAKHELKRLSLIATAIETYVNPSKEEIRQFVMSKDYGSEFDGYICTSQIEKDLYKLKHEFDAPIVYCKKSGGYKYENTDYKFWKHLLIGWSSFVDFPKEIKKILFGDENTERIKPVTTNIDSMEDTFLLRKKYIKDRLWEVRKIFHDNSTSTEVEKVFCEICENKYQDVIIHLRHFEKKTVACIKCKTVHLVSWD